MSNNHPKLKGRTYKHIKRMTSDMTNRAMVTERVAHIASLVAQRDKLIAALERENQHLKNEIGKYIKEVLVLRWVRGSSLDGPEYKKLLEKFRPVDE